MPPSPQRPLPPMATLGVLGDISKEQLGLPAYATQPLLQQDIYKELINKMAWAVGSTYRMPYHNLRTLARLVAKECARAIVTEHGYPHHIGYPE